MTQSQKPSITVAGGDRELETHFGEWSPDKGQWCFREAVELKVQRHGALAVAVAATTTLPLIGSVGTPPRRVAETRISIQEILPRLRVQDRDSEGLVYCTPVVGFPLAKGAVDTGLVYLSFETKTQIPLYNQNDDTTRGLGEVAFDSGAPWAGMVGWTQAKQAGRKVAA